MTISSQVRILLTPMNTPDDLRALGTAVFRAMRDVANRLETAAKDAKLAEVQQVVYDEVVDNLASKAREAVQQEMANLRAQLASLHARIRELEEENEHLRQHVPAEGRD